MVELQQSAVAMPARFDRVLTVAATKHRGRRSMQPPATEETWGDPTWERLEDQIAWYGTRSQAAQRVYNRLKIVQIVMGALIPFFAGFQTQMQSVLPRDMSLLPALLIAALGVVIVVLEGAQHLKQYHQNWLTYRATAEALKHEKYLFLADAGPYGAVDDKRGHLAERVEELISNERTGWVATRARGEAHPID
jgi:hypothetical protein